MSDDPLDGDELAMGGSPWWQVRPRELAARHSFSADELLDSIWPDDLAVWQLSIVFEAVEECHEEER